jgi:hypothetical protein
MFQEEKEKGDEDFSIYFRENVTLKVITLKILKD